MGLILGFHGFWAKFVNFWSFVGLSVIFYEFEPKNIIFQIYGLKMTILLSLGRKYNL